MLEAIAADPEGVFGSLRGVSADQAAAAAESWHASRGVRDLHVQLAPHGLAHLAAPIHARYGERSMAILHEDPYRLTEVDGVGFARADKIALAADVPPESSRRAQAAAVYALVEAEQQGNSYLPLEELTAAHGEADRPRARPRRAGRGAGACSLDEGRVYREPTHASELAVAATLRARAAAPPHLDHDPGEAPPARRADRRAVGGGARRLRARGSRSSPAAPASARPSARGRSSPRPKRPNATIALCAPTGRAARRLEEATGHEAQTIHRLLEWMPGREPAFRPGHPLPADLVIVDESSMLNLRLVEVLLGGLAESTHVVFVGDADQLPPIGAGKPFEDLIASGVAPVVRLTQIFRQAARSMITTAAHEINQGRPPHLEPGEDQDHDFFFIDRPTPSGRWRPWSRWSPSGRRRASASTRSARCRCWRRCTGGRSGSTPSTSACRRELNPDGKRGAQRALPDRRPPDPDPQLARAGADERLDRLPPRRRPRRGGDRRRHRRGRLARRSPTARPATLRLAYAISVHKAQGCEVPVVVGVCHRSHSRMLTRPLLYTAITRARSSCVAGRRPRRAGDGGAPRRQRRPPLRAWPSACAADADAPRDTACRMESRDRRRPRSRSPSPGSPCWRRWCSPIQPLREAVGGRGPRRQRRGAQQIDSLGVAGPLLILALTLLHAVVFYPAEIVDAAAGFAYGFFPALALMMFGWLLSGLVCFAIGRSVARPLLDRWFGAERFERVEAAIERGGADAAARDAADPDPPLQHRLLRRRRGAGAGLALRLDDRGRLPADHRHLVYFGTRLEGLSLTDPLVLGSALALLALLGGRPLGVRRQARRAAAEPRDSAHGARPGSGRRPASGRRGRLAPRALTLTTCRPEREAADESARRRGGRRAPSTLQRKVAPPGRSRSGRRRRRCAGAVRTTLRRVLDEGGRGSRLRFGCGPAAGVGTAARLDGGRWCFGAPVAGRDEDFAGRSIRAVRRLRPPGTVWPRSLPAPPPLRPGRRRPRRGRRSPIGAARSSASASRTSSGEAAGSSSRISAATAGGVGRRGGGAAEAPDAGPLPMEAKKVVAPQSVAARSGLESSSGEAERRGRRRPFDRAEVVGDRAARGVGLGSALLLNGDRRRPRSRWRRRRGRRSSARPRRRRWIPGTRCR